MIFYVHIILDIWFWGNWLNCHGKDWKKKLVEHRLFKQVHEVHMLGWYSSIKKSGPDVSHAQYWHRIYHQIQFSTVFQIEEYSCGGIYDLNTDQWCAGWGCCRRKDLQAMGESSLAVLKHWAHIAVIDVELLYKQMHKLMLTAIVTGGLSIIDWSEISIPNPAQSGLDSWSQREQQPRTTTD